MGQIRLDKYMANMGLGSRREVNEWIKAGLVKVDGEIIDLPKYKVADDSKLEFQGKEILYKKYTYLMMNKAKGRISASKDRSLTVLDDLKEEDRTKGLFPVGRLDKDTEGLLLLSNDGKLAHDLLSPKNEVEKTYLALLDRKLYPAEKLRIEQGVPLEAEGKISREAEISYITDRQVKITIHEGKYHQVKRMFAFCGIKVIELKRLSMGTLHLDPTLETGQYRELTGAEIEALKQLIKR